MLPLPLPFMASRNIEDKQDPTRPHDVSARDTKPSIKKKATPVTCHWAMMLLSAYVPLDDMRPHISSSLQDILESSSNEEKVMLGMTIYALIEYLKSKEIRNMKYLEPNFQLLFIPRMKTSLPNWMSR
jgi:hypothetical protein